MKHPFLLTLLVSSLFFFFATATSYDEDAIAIPISEEEVNLVVNIVDSTLVLSNEDTLDFVNAKLELYNITDTILFQGGYWTLQDYAIESGKIDTIHLSNFLDSDSISFPLDTIPTDFHFQAFTDNFSAVFWYEF